MRCARRLADAQRPASSTHSPAPIGSPSRPDPLSGHRRTRFFLLPALALLLGALSLFHAVPAQAQTPAAPTFSLQAGDAKFTVSWSAVTGANSYRIERELNSVAFSAATAVAGATAPATSSEISNVGAALIPLVNGTVYKVRMQACSNTNPFAPADELDCSAWTAAQTVTPNISLQWLSATANSSEGATTGLPLLISPSGGTVSSAVSATLTYAAGSSHPASLTDDLQTGYATTVSAAAGGTPTVSLAVPVDDTVNEEDETYTVTINAGTGYTVGTPSVLTVTIADNDPPSAPTLRVTPGGLRVTASWDKPDGPVAYYNLRYKTASAPDQPATGRDLSTGWVTNTVRNATSQIIDRLTAGTEYHVQVRANDGQTQAGNGDSEWSALVTGTPMALPTIALSATPNPVDEGESVTVTATLRSAAPDGGLVVPLTLTAGTAETGDYGALPSITVSAGQTTGTGTITTTVDTDPDDETFTVAIDRETMLAQGFAPGPGDEHAHQILIKDLSELELEINYGDQKLLIGPLGELGDPTHTYKRYVQASPTMKRLSLKLSWPAGAIASDPTAEVYYYMPGVAGDTLTWGTGQNGTTKTLEMYSYLGTPGYPKVTLSAGGGIEYTIIFQNNAAWEFHNNNLLKRLQMTIPQGQ